MNNLRTAILEAASEAEKVAYERGTLNMTTFERRLFSLIEGLAKLAVEPKPRRMRGNPEAAYDGHEIEHDERPSCCCFPKCQPVEGGGMSRSSLWPAKDVPDVAWIYWSLVDTMRTMPGMYGLDARRSELHAKLCETYGLTREQTLCVTDHMDRYETAVEMDLALRNIKKLIAEET